MSKHQPFKTWEGRRRRREIVERLLERCLGNCEACGYKMNRRHNHPLQATVDHIVPASKGGGDHFDNLRLVCARCNGKKGDDRQAGQSFGSVADGRDWLTLS
jgi:5-methylcytosine-specific restriction endonuclease McrA